MSGFTSLKLMIVTTEDTLEFFLHLIQQVECGNAPPNPDLDPLRSFKFGIILETEF